VRRNQKNRKNGVFMLENAINAIKSAVKFKREGIEGRPIESIVPFPLCIYQHDISLSEFAECRRSKDSFELEKAIAEYNYSIGQFILTKAGSGEKVLKPKIELYMEIYKQIPSLPLLGVSALDTIQNILKKNDEGMASLDEIMLTMKALFEILRLRADEEEITTPEGRDGWTELIKKRFDGEFIKKDNFDATDYSIPADLDDQDA
jgi:hypothetical protein